MRNSGLWRQIFSCHRLGQRANELPVATAGFRRFVLIRFEILSKG
jgi:hypothetical protein